VAVTTQLLAASCNVDLQTNNGSTAPRRPRSSRKMLIGR
jgi:hypothetical protein